MRACAHGESRASSLTGVRRRAAEPAGAQERLGHTYSQRTRPRINNHTEPHHNLMASESRYFTSFSHPAGPARVGVKREIADKAYCVSRFTVNKKAQTFPRFGCSLLLCVSFHC